MLHRDRTNKSNKIYLNIAVDRTQQDVCVQNPENPSLSALLALREMKDTFENPSLSALLALREMKDTFAVPYDNISSFTKFKGIQIKLM